MVFTRRGGPNERHTCIALSERSSVFGRLKVSLFVSLLAVWLNGYKCWFSLKYLNKQLWLQIAVTFGLDFHVPHEADFVGFQFNVSTTIEWIALSPVENYFVIN